MDFFSFQLHHTQKNIHIKHLQIKPLEYFSSTHFLLARAIVCLNDMHIVHALFCRIKH